METIQIIGRRWFDTKWGNTYHSVEVYVDNKFLDKNEYEYGYGEQYIQSAFTILQKHNYYVGKSYNDFLEARRENRNKFLISVSDVSRKKDL